MSQQLGHPTMQRGGPDDTLPLASHVWQEEKRLTEEILEYLFFSLYTTKFKAIKNYGSV